MFTFLIGDTITITRPNGTTETYTLYGGQQIAFADGQGVIHHDVLARPYITIKLQPER